MEDRMNKSMRVLSGAESIGEPAAIRDGIQLR